jgi:hypothetical protein
MKPLPPPEPRNPDGETRRVGVEIEFAGLPPVETARLVRDLFGGEVVTKSAHRLKVQGARWGDFAIELDTQYAHPDDSVVNAYPKDDSELERHRHQMRVDFHTRTRELIGDVVTGLVPTEIVCPPVPWDELEILDGLFTALREHGAKGTDASLLYGFGLHLNPEVASLEVGYLVDHLRAYLLNARALREQIDVDITREMLPHANPFPKAYALKVLDPGYAPDLDTLIDDYLEHNPTRNRELDLFPLFAHLRPDNPHELLHERLVKARPTFHYRLPDARLSTPGWGAVVEWNRWVEVERLAADKAALAQRAAAYLARHRRSLPRRWLDTLRGWVNAS